ncbi:hypothetical protein [Gloeocapsa sp. PCC 7428]|uniref:hypothetical protein n=1 Tax=Gloeocapsa sp. PCC 7428 TaxID=1173026 RepID=UPI0002E22BEC|nr:hypothetical protein [Gloeocapsa sp. PCC 7428]
MYCNFNLNNSIKRTAMLPPDWRKYASQATKAQNIGKAMRLFTLLHDDRQNQFKKH